MEALTAVSVACLTIYDMAKAIERGMRIDGIRLVEKTRRQVRPLPRRDGGLSHGADAGPRSAGQGARRRSSRCRSKPPRSPKRMAACSPSDLKALRTQPPADVSAMDGYAVRGEDVASVPARLKVIGEVAAGRPFAGAVGAGEAARIFTGGVLPPGRRHRRDPGNDRARRATRSSSMPRRRAAATSAPRGSTSRPARCCCARGHRLTSRSLALAAAMNHPTVPVHRRPKVALLATGDELVPPGSTPARRRSSTRTGSPSAR